MPASRVLLIVMANVVINVGSVWLLCRLWTRRRRADLDELERSRRLLMQQVRGLEATTVRGREVTS